MFKLMKETKKHKNPTQETPCSKFHAQVFGFLYRTLYRSEFFLQAMAMAPG